MGYKRCVVQSCSNTSRNCPDKVFVCLPVNEKRRLRWYKALNTTKVPQNSRNCVCEDHFNLPEDTQNWMYFKTMGKKVILKEDVVPHKNMFLLDTGTVKVEPSQLSDSSKKRKAEHLHKVEVSSIKKAKKVLFEDVKSSASSSSKASTQIELLHKHVEIQFKPNLRSQGTSTQDLAKFLMTSWYPLEDIKEKRKN